MDSTAFVEQAEKDLYAALEEAEAAKRQPGSVEDFFAAFLPMIPKINTFFDDVLVMAEDAKVKANRLGMLQRIAALADGVADMSRLGRLLNNISYRQPGGRVATASLTRFLFKLEWRSCIIISRKGRSGWIRFGYLWKRGRRKTFVVAIDWPGWARWGKEEPAAFDSLIEFAPRYGAVIAAAGIKFQVPESMDVLEMIARVEGNATTSFGAPDILMEEDKRPLSREEYQRSLAILQGCLG